MEEATAGSSWSTASSLALGGLYGSSRNVTQDRPRLAKKVKQDVILTSTILSTAFNVPSSTERTGNSRVSYSRDNYAEHLIDSYKLVNLEAAMKVSSKEGTKELEKHKENVRKFLHECSIVARSKREVRPNYKECNPEGEFIDPQYRNPESRQLREMFFRDAAGT